MAAEGEGPAAEGPGPAAEGEGPAGEGPGPAADGAGLPSAAALFTQLQQSCSSFLAPRKPQVLTPFGGTFWQGRNLVQGISRQGLDGV